MRVFGSEPREQSSAKISFAIPIGIFEKRQMRHLRNIDSAITQDKRQRDVQLIGKYRRLVCFSISIGVFEDDDRVIRLIAGLDVGVGL